MLTYASHQDACGRVWYVSSTPGRDQYGKKDGSKSWGYCSMFKSKTSLDHAIPLSKYWQLRFAGMCRNFGYIPRFFDREEDTTK
jgi:hypothetical protein